MEFLTSFSDAIDCDQCTKTNEKLLKVTDNMYISIHPDTNVLVSIRVISEFISSINLLKFL